MGKMPLGAKVTMCLTDRYVLRRVLEDYDRDSDVGLSVRILLSYGMTVDYSVSLQRALIVARAVSDYIRLDKPMDKDAEALLDRLEQAVREALGLPVG